MNSRWKKNAVAFIGSQMVSMFGSALVQYAITWYITLSTKSGAMMTLTMMCHFIPTVVLSPFAGVWADRHDRKKLVILADAGIAVCTLAVAISYWMGYQAVWLLLLATVIRAIGSAVQSPATGAMLPDFVPQEQLTRINGIQSSLNSATLLLSPALGAWLYAQSPMEYIFLIDVATAVFAIVILSVFLRVPVRAREQGGEQHFMRELSNGIRYVAGHKYLVSFFVFSAAFMFLAAPVAMLTPLQVARNFKDDSWHLMAIEIAFSGGMLLGGLIIAAWGGFKNRMRTMIFGGIATSICTIALGVPMPFACYLAFMTLCGLSMPIFNTPATVLLQERVDPAMLGRVFSVMTLIGSTMMPLGMALFGPLADGFISIDVMLLCTGTLMLVSTLLMSKNRSLILAGEKLPDAQYTVGDHRGTATDQVDQTD